MAERAPDAHEKAAAGLDFDDNGNLREGAASFGSRVAAEGPGAILDEIENMLPESWRAQIREFPIAAVLLGLGVGVWLGMKKSDEIIAAGTSFVSAAALSNVGEIMDRIKPA